MRRRGRDAPGSGIAGVSVTHPHPRPARTAAAGAQACRVQRRLPPSLNPSSSHPSIPRTRPYHPSTLRPPSPPSPIPHHAGPPPTPSHSVPPSVSPLGCSCREQTPPQILAPLPISDSRAPGEGIPGRRDRDRTRPRLESSRSREGSDWGGVGGARDRERRRWGGCS